MHQPLHCLFRFEPEPSTYLLLEPVNHQEEFVLGGNTVMESIREISDLTHCKLFSTLEYQVSKTEIEMKLQY